MEGKNLINWAEKYRVDSFENFKGQDTAIQEVKAFLSSFPAKKAALLHGPPGIGKTTLAFIIKKEFDLELYELNASDFRNKEQLHNKLKPASEQSSLFKKGKILLVDEVDGLSTRDRGGLQELLSLIENSKFPLIITANDVWNSKFSSLRKKCKLVQLKDLDYKDILDILQNISSKEGLQVENNVLTSISVRSKGDVRAAINDLQTISSDKDLMDSYLNLGERNREVDIFNALKLVFKGMFNNDVLRTYDSVNLPLDKIFLWIEENIPYEYSGEELHRAYEVLSLADVFRGRIMRQRHWRFLVYQNILLSAGISLSKKNPKMGFTKYRNPTRILKIWLNNQKEKNKKTIISKFASHTHCSKKKASQQFQFIKTIIKNPEVQKQLDLSDQELEYVNKLK